MKYNPDIHHRRSIRLKGDDYSQASAYFVSICVQNREYLFGEIIDGKMELNDAGRMVRMVWDEMSENYPGIKTDEFVPMPNHVHGIIAIVGAGPCACPVQARNNRHDARGDCKTGQPRGDCKTGQPRGVVRQGNHGGLPLRR